LIVSFAVYYYLTKQKKKKKTIEKRFEQSVYSK
jgi:hypothetical protein